MSISDSGPFERGEPGARGGAQGATGAPDFPRHDRGDADDHWSRAAGQTCGNCDTELVSIDFVRRRPDGVWVHENCPRGPRDGELADEAEAEA